MNLPPPDIIPLIPSIRKGFYESLVVLRCMTQSCVHGKSVEALSYETAPPTSQEQIYFRFVDKLGQICDSKRGGETVTSFAVLRLGTVRYWFASNQRGTTELNEARDYVTDILNTLHSTSGSDAKRAIRIPQRQVYRDILQKIIKFNRPRLERYIERLSKELEICIEEMDEAEDSEDDYLSAEENVADTPQSVPSFPENLETLKRLAQFAGTKPKVNNEEFAAQTQALMYTLGGLYHGEFENFLREKCLAKQAELARHRAHGHLDEPLRSAWDETYHCIGRLLSYFLAVKILLSARLYWPELFDDFEVMPLPSSRPDRDPPGIRQSAERIIKSMSAAVTDDGESLLSAYRQSAEHLQAWGLDARIKEITHHSHFKPFIHAEVIVDDAIRRARRQAVGAGQEPVEFFRESEFGRYIGSSKPTCRLCASYFTAQPDGVRVRPSHGNLYHNWRAPDVFASDGEAVERRRNTVLSQMTAKLREETSQVIRTKSAPWRAWDSNNTATNPLPDKITVSTSTGMDAISAQVGELKMS